MIACAYQELKDQNSVLIFLPSLFHIHVNFFMRCSSELQSQAKQLKYQQGI